MVGSKVRVTMGFHKSSSTKPKHQQDAITTTTTTPPPLPLPLPPKRSSSSSSAKPANPTSSNHKQVFSRSFGVYFPRSSVQVHAASRSSPSDYSIVELRRQVEELRDREAFLQTDLLELKIFRESVSVIPVLESRIAEKNVEIEMSRNTVMKLEEENVRLKALIAEMNEKIEEQRGENEEHAPSSSQRFQGLIDVSSKSNLLKSLKRVRSTRTTPDPTRFNSEESVCGIDKIDKPSRSPSHSEELTESSSLSTIRIPRVPKPPPKRCDSTENRTGSETQTTVSNHTNSLSPSPPPPPPPPPPPKSLLMAPAKVRRIPEVVEFYHSLMRRDSIHSRRDITGGGNATDTSLATSSKSRDMIGEIENRSAYLLAIKTDVETQGDFIRFLIKEVENAAFSDIEDVVPFVKWLDDELSYLVDERAVLKHFQWPEQKADALREAAFCYFDLKKLISEASRFKDDDYPQSSASALKKIQALFEKLEHSVYSLSRTKESASTKLKIFHIPVDWMLETGITTQIKLACVKLAMKYMKRVLSELKNNPEDEELMVQGVRFAFRVHQFAGGFDVETMRAFEELRDKATPYHVQSQSQSQDQSQTHQHKPVSRSTTCS